MLRNNADISFSLIEYGSDEYDRMVSLREAVLRRPLGLTFSKNDLEKEKEDFLIAAFADVRIVACCILTPRKDKRVQLRQMAVDESFRNRSIGLQLLYFTEKVARRAGFDTLLMHAREEAVGFYKKAGYEISGEAFTEVGIPHYLMMKKLIASGN